MSTPEDRLQELRRQRALVQQHLAWLDREIAASAGAFAPPSPPPPPALPAEPVRSAAEHEADILLESYREESRSAPAAARRGCLIFFFLALALLGLGVLALYFHVSSGNPPAR